MEEIEKGKTKCEACDGTGKVISTIPAHQAAGHIVDEHSREITCDVCEGKGWFFTCPDYEDGHHFEKSDGWYRTCNCGAVE